MKKTEIKSKSKGKNFSKSKKKDSLKSRDFSKLKGSSNFRDASKSRGKSKTTDNLKKRDAFKTRDNSKYRDSSRFKDYSEFEDNLGFSDFSKKRDNSGSRGKSRVGGFEKSFSRSFEESSFTNDKSTFKPRFQSKFKPKRRYENDFDNRLESNQEFGTVRKSSARLENRKKFYGAPSYAAPSKVFSKKQAKTFLKQNLTEDTDSMPLNKYLSTSGICSRREAVQFIEAGQVQVNNRIIREPGYKVSQKDEVCFKGDPIRTEKKVYILLNKPNDYITTLSDEKGRKSVADIFAGSIKERIFPVGRLDRNTTGLLLMTNDGLLSQKLSHPSFEITKIYSVVLDRDMTSSDLILIKNGLNLKDGFIKPDKVYFESRTNRKKLVVQIHSGKNRIVRRIFKEVGYNLIRLDRTNYAGLVKGGLKPGYWRYLNRQEVETLNNLSTAKKLDRVIKSYDDKSFEYKAKAVKTDNFFDKRVDDSEMSEKPMGDKKRVFKARSFNSRDSKTRDYKKRVSNKKKLGR